MKIAFAGTPEAAVPSLRALVESEQHEVLAVLTQPDRRAGRGRHLMPSPVKLFAQSQAIPVLQPERLDAAIQSTLKDWALDAIVVVAYGLLVPKSLLTIPKHGCVNVHFSLLPRWRGASPIQHTLLYGDEMTGVTVMELDEGLDTGLILSQERYSVDPNENSQDLHERLAKAGAHLLLNTLDAMAHGAVRRVAQNNAYATHAPKIKKSQGQIDWKRPAMDIVHQVRAFNPWPVAFTYFQGKRLRIWEAAFVDVNVSVNSPSSNEVMPGQVIKVDQQGIEVATADKALRIIVLQAPGGRVMSAQAFINAHPIRPGEVFC